MNTEVDVELFLSECDRHLTLLEASGLRLQREGPNGRLLEDMWLHVSTLMNVSFRMGIIQLVYLAYGVEVILKRICSSRYKQDDNEIHMLFVLFDRMRQRLDSILISYMEYGHSGHHAISECIYAFPFHLYDRDKDDIDIYHIYIKEYNKSLYSIYIRIRNDCIRIPTKMLEVYQAIKESGELITSIPEETEIWREHVCQSEARILAYLDSLIINDLIKTIFHIRDVEVCDILKLSS